MWPPWASLPVTLTLSSVSLALVSTASRSKKLTTEDLVDIFSRCARGRFIKLHACGYLFFENDRGFSVENTAPSPLTPYHLFQPQP